MKKVKGLNKQTNNRTHRHRQQYGDYKREREEGSGAINGDGRRLHFGW